MLRAAAWVASAAALLTLGFLAWVQLGAAIATDHAEPDAVQQMHAAFAVYARVVLVKGLLPALLLALAFWPLLDRVGRFSRRGRLGLALGLALAATLASVAIAAALMPLAAPGLPSVTYTGTGNFVRTCMEMAGAVMLAAWIPRNMPKRYTALIAAGLGVVLVAGAASMTHWARFRPPQAPAPAPVSGPVALPAPVPVEPVPSAPQDRREPAVAPPDRAPHAGDPGWEELERRRAAAARLRKLIEAGPGATEPAIAGGLLAEAEPHPVYENGELLGIELQNLRPDGFYARLGLREGDLVQSINGVGLDASGELVSEFIRSPQIELSVERSDGTQDSISVPREQIIEELLELE
jgi:hypothetical protein